jgi:hypothetical protein
MRAPLFCISNYVDLNNLVYVPCKFGFSPTLLALLGSSICFLRSRCGWMAPKNIDHCNLYMIRVFFMQQKFTFNLWYTYFCFVHVFYIVIVKCFFVVFLGHRKTPICVLYLFACPRQWKRHWSMTHSCYTTHLYCEFLGVSCLFISYTVIRA